MGDDLFDVTRFNPTPIYHLFEFWGPNSSLTFEQLTKKLLVLIVLHSGLFPSDCNRIVYSYQYFGTVEADKKRAAKLKENHLKSQKEQAAFAEQDKILEEKEKKKRLELGFTDAEVPLH